MLRIGLTGGIGSGKTTVCQVFSALGVLCYNADQEARRLMENDNELINRILSLFGEKAYIEGKLNRSFLGSLVFRDTELLSELNSIVHPAVQNDFIEWSLKYTDHAYVLEEAAILFESGAAKIMDYTIFVKSDLQTRIERVVNRDNIKVEEVKTRMENQMRDTDKESLADFVIYNEIDSMILPQIVDLHYKFIELNK